MLLIALVNDNHENKQINSNDKMFQNDGHRFHTSKQNDPFNINHLGFYRTSCIEFELVPVTICAVLNFQKIHQTQASNFHPGKNSKCFRFLFNNRISLP